MDSNINEYDWNRLKGLGLNLDYIEKSLRSPEANPCWKGYEPVGTKKKGNRQVPNCVPIQKKFSENPVDESVIAPTLRKHPTKPPTAFTLSEPSDKPCGIHTNGGMATSQLKSMLENISVILTLIGPDSNLDPWMASKITEAEHGMTAVADYLKYKE